MTQKVSHQIPFPSAPTGKRYLSMHGLISLSGLYLGITCSGMARLCIPLSWPWFLMFALLLHLACALRISSEPGGGGACFYSRQRQAVFCEASPVYRVSPGQPGLVKQRTLSPENKTERTLHMFCTSHQCKSSLGPSPGCVQSLAHSRDKCVESMNQ